MREGLAEGTTLNLRLKGGGQQTLQRVVQLELSSGGGGLCQVRIRNFHLERSRIVRWTLLEVWWEGVDQIGPGDLNITVEMNQWKTVSSLTRLGCGV